MSEQQHNTFLNIYQRPTIPFELRCESRISRAQAYGAIDSNLSFGDEQNEYEITKANIRGFGFGLVLFFAIAFQLLASGLIFSSSKEIKDSEDTKYGCMAAIAGFLPATPTIFSIWGLV